MRRAEEGLVGLVSQDPEPLSGRGPALQRVCVDLEAPWRVSVPSSCSGALKLARARRRAGSWASWVSKSSLIQGFSTQKVPLRITLLWTSSLKCVLEVVRLDTDRSDALARE